MEWNKKYNLNKKLFSKVKYDTFHSWYFYTSFMIFTAYSEDLALIKILRIYSTFYWNFDISVKIKTHQSYIWRNTCILRNSTSCNLLLNKVQTMQDLYQWYFAIFADVWFLKQNLKVFKLSRIFNFYVCRMRR